MIKLNCINYLFFLVKHIEVQLTDSEIHLSLAYAVLCFVAQLCLTRFNPMDCSLPGSSGHMILQARILEWVAMPLPGDLHNPGIEPALQVDSSPSEPPGKPIYVYTYNQITLLYT